MLFEPSDASSPFTNASVPINNAVASTTLGETAKGVAESVADATQNTAATTWSWVQSVSFVKYLVIILILAVLGLNVFKILSKTTDSITDIVGGPIRNIVASFAWMTGETAKQVVTTAADGIDKTVDVAETVAVGGIDAVEKTLTGERGSLDGDLNKLSDEIDSDVDDADDESLKAGYCYIGADRGIRSCARVGDADKCMSGDIFPTKETCVNPKLRA